jgi:hypothetical protein
MDERGKEGKEEEEEKEEGREGEGQLEKVQMRGWNQGVRVRNEGEYKARWGETKGGEKWWRCVGSDGRRRRKKIIVSRRGEMKTASGVVG